MRQHFTRIFNPTLENLDVQCNSRLFRFKAREFLEIPEQYADMIIESWKHRGLFEFRNGDDFKSKERDGLIAFVQNTINDRIRNYTSWMDDMKKRGITLEEPAKLKQAKDARKQIIKLLEMTEPIEKVLSYLEPKNMEVKESDFADLLGKTTPEETEDPVKKKRGKPVQDYADLSEEAK